MRVALIEEGGIGEGGRGKYIEEGDGGEYCGRKRDFNTILSQRQISYIYPLSRLLIEHKVLTLGFEPFLHANLA